jgi:ABC-type branched-subunit amino acid transport system ATPase component
MSTPLLQVRGVRAGYGHLEVIAGIDLEVPPASANALLGTNGAGKSTLLKVLAGLLRPTSGSVLFDGEDITDLRPEARVERGLTLVEGGRSSFPSLTVAESIRIGAHRLPRAQSAEVDRRVADVLELLPALQPLQERSCGALSGGEQQMVAIARALVSRPRLLLVDELSLGLAPVVMTQLVAVVSELAGRGVSVLLVEQSLNIAVTLTTHAWFLEKGTVRFSGPPAQLLERGDLARAIFLRTPA